MKTGKLVLLLSKDESYLIEINNKNFNTKSGIIKLEELKKVKTGDKLKTHLGKEFIVVEPNLIDFLEKKAKRLPQIIMPKDLSLILAYTGIRPNSLIVDCGTGSGFTSIFLAHYNKPGKVVTYEINKHFIKIAKENIKKSNLEKYIKLKQKDVTKGIDEKNVDLVTIDMKNPEKVVSHAYKSLKIGGFLAVYSPTIEEVIRVNKEIRRKGFSYIKTVENIVREWQVEKTTRPKNIGLIHTGWLTFARKVS